MSATQKWCSVVIDIVSYEALHLDDGELLSEACWRWIEKSPIFARVFIITSGTVLTLHLAKVIPRECDIISKCFWVMRLPMVKTVLLRLRRRD